MNDFGISNNKSYRSVTGAKSIIDEIINIDNGNDYHPTVIPINHQNNFTFNIFKSFFYMIQEVLLPI